MKIFFLVQCFFLVNFISPLLAQNFPLRAKVDWHYAGLQKDYADVEPVVNILDFGAVADGQTDISPALNLALEALGESGGVIFFPEGAYRSNQTFRLTDGVILRGAGANLSKIEFYIGGDDTHCISVVGIQEPFFRDVIGGYQKGSARIIVGDAEGLEEGDYLEIQQKNGGWDTEPASWAENAIGQILRIEAVNDDTVTLSHPLRINYSGALRPQLRKIFPKEGVGIECLHIERKTDQENTVAFNILFSFAANCWVRGVHSEVSVGSHVFIEASSNILIEGSHFHEAFEYDGKSTHGYGVTLAQHTGECLIQNNIFHELRHAMMVKQGANGNVFAYNYSVAPKRVEFLENAGGDISLHGHYPYGNLFEGNHVQNIVIDHFWGESGPGNTFFRNRVSGYGIVITGNGNNTTKYQNFIGNEIRGPNGLMGFYMLKGEGHFEYGNIHRGKLKPENTDNLSLRSLYYTGQPNFWYEQLGWPAFGDYERAYLGQIPAQKRTKLSEKWVVCDASDSLSQDTLSTSCLSDFKLELYPVPVKNKLNFKIQAGCPGKYGVFLCDISGNIYNYKYWFSVDNKCVFDYFFNLSYCKEGEYIIYVVYNNVVIMCRKIVKF